MTKQLTLWCPAYPGLPHAHLVDYRGHRLVKWETVYMCYYCGSKYSVLRDRWTET